jgi:hypothetical protein
LKIANGVGEPRPIHLALNVPTPARFHSNSSKELHHDDAAVPIYLHQEGVWTF